MRPTAGEEVTFSEVVGMTELNGHAPIRVKNCKAHSFYLEVDSTNWRCVLMNRCECFLMCVSQSAWRTSLPGGELHQLAVRLVLRCHMSV